MNTYSRRLPQASSLVGSLLLAGLPITAAVGQLQIAENLLINVDAATFSSGQTTWTNTGTLTGNFTATGAPTFQTINSQPAVFFDDAEQFVGPVSPDGIEGSGTTSIEVWAYQGFIRGEESLVSWGRRGDDGRNMSLNYGADGRWGAVGHWGGADIGWGPNDPNGTEARPPGTPVEGQWHYLTYTYDGTTQRVYKDGLLVNQENVSLNIHPDFTINIGAQRSNAGPEFGIEPANRLGGAIGKVRVHDGVLTPAQIASNFTLEKTAYGRVDENTYNRVNAQLPALPRNRYTFNGLASGADGTTVPDVIGGKNALIKGPGVVVTASGVDLPGGPQTQGYIDLPNGIFSGTANGPAYSSASYEAWVTVQGNNNWSRIMDFGSSSNLEVTGPGGAGNGTNYMFLSANSGTDPGITIDRGGDGGIPGGGAVGGGGRTTQNTNLLGTEQHVVMIYDFVDQEWRWYQNGNLMEGFTSTGGPGTVNDVNNWLGRSNWGNDANLDAIFNEFRIYDYALTQEQVQGNFAAGPNSVNVVPEPSVVGLLGLGAIGSLIRRRRR